jgi:hypothetical protein
VHVPLDVLRNVYNTFYCSITVRWHYDTGDVDIRQLKYVMFVAEGPEQLLAKDVILLPQQ